MWWLTTRKGLLMYMWDYLGGIKKPLLKKSRFYHSALHVVFFDMDVGSQDGLPSRQVLPITFLDHDTIKRWKISFKFRILV